MRIHLRSVLVVAAAFTMCACATTNIRSTWKAPDAKPIVLAPGTKVVAMVISPNESTRRAAETILASELDKRGLEGIPAFNVVPTAALKDKEQARSLIESSGAAGIVVMRVTGQKQELTGSGPTYGGFWGGYYGMGWAAAYSPGYLRTDTTVYIETLVYDLKNDKLIWASQSDTLNPQKAEDLIRELVSLNAVEMKKEGVIATPTP